MGGGYMLFSNPQLCYVGDLSLYISDGEHVCTNDTARKDPRTCSERGTVEYSVFLFGGIYILMKYRGRKIMHHYVLTKTFC